MPALKRFDTASTERYQKLLIEKRALESLIEGTATISNEQALDIPTQAIAIPLVGFGLSNVTASNVSVQNSNLGVTEFDNSNLPFCTGTVVTVSNYFQPITGGHFQLPSIQTQNRSAAYIKASDSFNRASAMRREDSQNESELAAYLDEDVVDA